MYTKACFYPLTCNTYLMNIDSFETLPVNLKKTKDAAEYVGVSEFYMKNMRLGQHNHEGPKFRTVIVKNCLVCVYEIQDLNRWKAEHNWRNRNRKKAV